MPKSILEIYTNEYRQHDDSVLEEILSRQENLIKTTEMRIEAIKLLLDTRKGGGAA